MNHAADDAETRSSDSRTAIEPVPSGSSATPPNGQMFVDFFRQASPYIANHRGATFVVHVPGSVMADPDRAILEGIDDIAMLNSLGARVAVVVGSNEQVSAMCARRSVPVEVVDGYRVTTPESLEIAMEAAGRNDVLVQALLSQGVNIAVTRKHGDSRDPRGAGGGGGYAFEETPAYGSDIDVMSRDRWGSNANAGRPGGGASATSGTSSPPSVAGSCAAWIFQYTGDVVYVDVDAVAQRLRFGDVVLLSSLGFNAAGEVLNCQSYDVAVSLAVDVAADKLISYVAPGDMPVGEDGARAKYMPLRGGGRISRLASRGCSDETTGLETTKDAEEVEEASPSMPEQWRWLDREGDDEVRGALAEKSATRRDGGDGDGNDGNAFSSPWRRLAEKGLRWRVDGCPQEISAAVFSCKAGVRRAHPIDYTVPGALLLELYTLDGVGAMVSRDRYEGTRRARPEDWTHIKSILEPLAKQGVTVAHGSDDELIEEVTSGAFAVTERDGKIIACAALRRYKTVETTTERRVENDDVIGEIAAFAVRPGYRNEGRGDALLEYLEREARRENIQTLFLLTTRGGLVHARGFAHAGAADTSPLLPPGKKTMPGRNSQLYVRSLNDT